MKKIVSLLLILLLLLFVVTCAKSNNDLDETGTVLDTALVYEPTEPSQPIELPREYERPDPAMRGNPTTAAREAPPPPPMAAPPAANGSSTATSEVDAILDKLGSGGVLFDSPNTMVYHKSTIIKVVLYPPETTMPAPTAEQDTGTALISNRMEAQLTGEGFNFIALTPEVQAISARVPTEWRWQVTPVERGDLMLHLSILAKITVEGRETPFTLETFERYIQVTITPSQMISNFFGENWKWMWGALFIPIFGYLWKRFRDNKNRKE